MSWGLNRRTCLRSDSTGCRSFRQEMRFHANSQRPRLALRHRAGFDTSMPRVHAKTFFAWIPNHARSLPLLAITSFCEPPCGDGPILRCNPDASTERPEPGSTIHSHCLYTLYHGIRHPTWPAPSQENQRDTARTNLTAILVAVGSSGIEQFALGLPLPETRRSERVPVGELHADIVAQDLRELPAGGMQACMPRKDAHLKPETTGDAADIVTRHQGGPGRQVTDVP